jgi:hypothetical protein
VVSKPEQKAQKRTGQLKVRRFHSAADGFLELDRQVSITEIQRKCLVKTIADARQ